MINFLEYSNSWEILYNSALLNHRQKLFRISQSTNIIIKQYEISNTNLSLVYFWKAYSEYHSSAYNAALKSIKNHYSAADQILKLNFF